MEFDTLTNSATHGDVFISVGGHKYVCLAQPNSTGELKFKRVNSDSEWFAFGKITMVKKLGNIFDIISTYS